MSKHTEFAAKNFRIGYQAALADINAKLALEGVNGVKQWLADNLTSEAHKDAALNEHGAALETKKDDAKAVARAEVKSPTSTKASRVRKLTETQLKGLRAINDQVGVRDLAASTVTSLHSRGLVHIDAITDKLSLSQSGRIALLDSNA